MAITRRPASGEALRAAGHRVSRRGPFWMCRLALLAGVNALPGLRAPTALPAQPAAQRGASWVDYSWTMMPVGRNAPVPFAAFRHRNVFLHVWATWCKECQPELATISRLQAALTARGFRDSIDFVLVAPQKENASIRAMAQHFPALSFYLEHTPMARSMHIATLPTTLLIDREGRVVLKSHGTRTWDTRTVVNAIAALILQPNDNAK